MARLRVVKQIAALKMEIELLTDELAFQRDAERRRQVYRWIDDKRSQLDVLEES
jgi:hypothetical protein